MIVLSALILLAAVLCVWLLTASQDRERARWAKERTGLLDRIQHPEIRQVEPREPVEYEPPKDAAELAQVGHLVPAGVQVGTWQDEINQIGETDA